MVPVGAVVDATLFGGLGSDGKNDSLVLFGTTVPLVGNVGDPVEIKLNLEKCDHLSIMCDDFSRHHMAFVGRDFRY